jgi:hypothetical protein
MVMLVIVGVLFLAGAASGCLAVVVVGIHREERARSLTSGYFRGRLVNGTRAINGVYTRGLDQHSDRQARPAQLVLSASDKRAA